MQATCMYDEPSRCASQFTGKERDSETGLDYFGARYYGSTMGRWLSPDWSSSPMPVPYATLGDPQTLNLYAYVRNNPVSQADADGHCFPICALVSWFTGAAATDGGVKAAAKNVGIGLAKGAGQVALGVGVGLAEKAVPGAAIGLGSSKTGQKAVQAVTPSNKTQAQAAAAGAEITTTAVTIGASAGIGALGGLASTEASTTYFHYGYSADEAQFAGGLRAGAYATTDGGLTGAEAQSLLALPNRSPGVPDAVYPVTPEPGTPMTGPTTVKPANGYDGGGVEVQFPQGTGPGTVGPAKSIPPQ